jgi:hypothetical protein
MGLRAALRRLRPLRRLAAGPTSRSFCLPGSSWPRSCDLAPGGARGCPAAVPRGRPKESALTLGPPAGARSGTSACPRCAGACSTGWSFATLVRWGVRRRVRGLRPHPRATNTLPLRGITAQQYQFARERRWRRSRCWRWPPLVVKSWVGGAREAGGWHDGRDSGWWSAALASRSPSRLRARRGRALYALALPSRAPAKRHRVQVTGALGGAGAGRRRSRAMRPAGWRSGARERAHPCCGRSAGPLGPGRPGRPCSPACG